MVKKVTTIEELGDLLHGHMNESRIRHNENRESFNSVGEHLVSIEKRLDNLAELFKVRERVERIANILREKLDVEV